MTAKHTTAPSGTSRPMGRGSADTAKRRWDRLTSAEWQLVVFGASGWNDREIAEATRETSSRVKSRIQQLRDMLGLPDPLTLILATFAEEPEIANRILAD